MNNKIKGSSHPGTNLVPHHINGNLTKIHQSRSKNFSSKQLKTDQYGEEQSHFGGWGNARTQTQVFKTVTMTTGSSILDLKMFPFFQTQVTQRWNHESIRMNY